MVGLHASLICEDLEMAQIGNSEAWLPARGQKRKKETCPKKSPAGHRFGRFFAGPQISSGSRFRGQEPPNRQFFYCFDHAVIFCQRRLVVRFHKIDKNSSVGL